MDLFLQKVQTHIEYNFLNQNLIYQAFITPSYYLQNKDVLDSNGLSDNSLLVIIGQSFLEAMISSKIIIENSNLKKGLISSKSIVEIRNTISSLTNEEAIADAIKKTGFNNYLLLNDEEKENSAINNITLQANLLRAIIGALVIDTHSNMDTISKVTSKILNVPSINKSEKDIYSQKLLDYAKENKVLPPTYRFFELQKGMFRCMISFDIALPNGMVESHISEGKGNSKLIAKKEASLNALQLIEKNLPKPKPQFPNFDLDNAINVLQELSQKKIIGDILYDYYQDKGDWISVCKVGELQAQARAITKKDAKKEAAFNLLKLLKEQQGE